MELERMTLSLFLRFFCQVTVINILMIVGLSLNTAQAARFMTIEELKAAQQATMHFPPAALPSNRLPPVYREAISRTARFIANLQVSDSSSADFGGIREAEHWMDIVQTDNTMEAIWVWSRYFQLFGADSFKTNIQRAWIYAQHHPAWLEEDTGSDYYRDWNCGIGLFAESKYREVYGDSSYLHAYADTCISYFNTHPLNFNQKDCTILHPFVTALCSGMLYRYWKDRNVQAYRDTAVARGVLVKTWIEGGAQTRLQSNYWVMSGGTALWGVCNSVLQEDTSTANTWLDTYVDSMNFFQSNNGTWNDSWNIYRAWGYRAAWEIGHVPQWKLNHKRLTDTLLSLDQDLDGGIMDTWSNSQNSDAAWVSSYLDFMGMDYYCEPFSVASKAPEASSLKVSLGQSYPNPFRGEATISYSLSHRCWVNLAIYNPRGERTVTLVRGQNESGIHLVKWHGHDHLNRDVTAGAYFYRLAAGGQSFTGKIILAQ
jgi:hypothetical protein